MIYKAFVTRKKFVFVWWAYSIYNFHIFLYFDKKERGIGLKGKTIISFSLIDKINERKDNRIVSILNKNIFFK